MGNAATIGRGSEEEEKEEEEERGRLIMAADAKIRIFDSGGNFECRIRSPRVFLRGDLFEEGGRVWKKRPHGILKSSIWNN